MPCFDAMCNGHGGCNGGAACECEPGWTGEKCTNGPPECPNGCQHGTCNRLQGMCACDAGWTGDDCSASDSGPAAAQARAKQAAAAKEEAEGPKPPSGPLQDVGSIGSPTG